jgi:thiol-disulfide isomerase/thioredoxin
VAEHWWDGFDFADTLSVARWGEYTEQAFVDFDYGLLMQVPQEISEGALGVLFKRAAANKDVFWKFAEIAEKYLYDGNSPARNEELYIPVLRAVLANPSLDEWERMRPEEQLRLTLKNRVGDAANDFTYTLASGATGTLYGLRAPFTLLFFNNPGCPTCRSMMDTIAATPYLQALIEDGTLKVLAVYTDEDLTAWRDYLPQMPEGWIASYDAARKIPTEDLYDLKAIPTLYLLDRDKRVLLKDEMSIPRIEQTIYNLQQQ